MEYDLSLFALVNAGGAFLFFAIGIAILAVGRRSQRGRLVGGLAATWGLVLVFDNILEYETTAAGPEPWIVAALGLPVIALAVALILHLVKGVPPSWRRFVGWVAAVQAVAWAGIVAAFFGAFEEGAPIAIFGTGVDALAVGSVLSAKVSTFIVLLAACVARFHAEPIAAAHARRAMVGLTLAFGFFTVFLCVFNMAGGAAFPLDRWEAWMAGAGLFVHAVSAAIAAAAFLVPNAGDEPRLARSAFIALLGAGAVSLVVVLVGHGNRDYGAFGILRTVSATLLAFAIVKHDLLKVPLPRLVVRSGVLAGGALAVLFIVAQIAQNFFSAEYGLLMGGGLAGTFVFAASPIQRAIERASDGKPGSTSSRVAQVRQAESAYRNAVTMAYKDRRFTHKEELALADLAETLGLGVRRATEIRHEIETTGGG